METTVQRLAARLARAGADAALLSRPDDVVYATGVDAGARGWEPPLALVTARGDALLVNADVPFAHERPVDAAHDYAAALATALRDAGLDGSGTLAVDRTSLPAAVAALLRPARLLDARPLVRDARLVKTEAELALVRAAAAAADAANDALPGLAASPVNELDLAAGVLARATRAAAEPQPWPDGIADRELTAGDVVRLDLRTRVRGYWARTSSSVVVAREPTDEHRRAWRAAREAHEAAVFELWPGRRASDAYEAAATALRRHGFRIAEAVGSQVGASAREEPHLVAYDHTPLEPGMVFAVATAAAGVRAGRVVLVTEAAPEVVSRFRWAIDG